jgi:hypothetical protein
MGEVEQERIMHRMRNTLSRLLMLVAIAGVARADLSLVGGKLELDAAAWANSHWWRGEQGGLAQSEFVMDRVTAPVGLTGHLSPVASLRVSADVGAIQATDLYVDFHWLNGLGLRVGQFLLPLGFDLMTDPAKQLLVSSSFLAGYAAPAGSRDIGLMGGLQNGVFSVTGAVVSGAGANLGDYDLRKDVCGRITVKPLSTVNGVLALHVYYRGPDASDTAWRALAGEARLSRGSLELQAEFQNRYSRDVRNNVAYLQAVWRAGHIEPVARFDLVQPQGSRSEWMVTGGLNLVPIPDHLRVMFDCTYHQNYQANWSVFGFLFRVQAAI